MALLFIEGFEGWGQSTGVVPDASMQRRWDVPTDFNLMDIEAGRITGYCLEWGTSFIRNCTSPDLGANTSLYTGFGFKCASVASNIIFGYIEPGGGLGLNIRHAGGGELQVRRNSTILGTTSGLGLAINTWYYIEFYCLINNSTGAYELRVGESNVLSDSGIDTQNGATAELRQIRLYGSNGGPNFDDLYVSDSAFLGNSRVDAIFPNAAGDATDWTPDSGSNYARVNEAVTDDDTSYVESGTTTDQDLYNYDSVPVDLNTVHGIQIATECRETDATTFDLKTLAKSGTTTSADAGSTIGSTSYVEKRRILETNPDTASAWTPSELNSAQFGVEVG